MDKETIMQIQCKPLKEPLNAPKECDPCYPGLGNRRCMPMGHVGIVASEPVVGASDLIAVDVRNQELPKVFILREQYDKLDPAVIREKQEEAHCILVPIERDEMDRIRQEAVGYMKAPEMPKLPGILWQEPSPYYGGANISESHKHIGGRQEPKDYAKKKKAKRRQQKQARRKNK